MMLTPRQAQALAFIASENAAGRYPTGRDLCRALGVAGYSIANRLMERGFVARFLKPDDLKSGRRGGLVALPRPLPGRG